MKIMCLYSCNILSIVLFIIINGMIGEGRFRIVQSINNQTLFNFHSSETMNFRSSMEPKGSPSSYNIQYPIHNPNVQIFLLRKSTFHEIIGIFVLCFFFFPSIIVTVFSSYPNDTGIQRWEGLKQLNYDYKTNIPNISFDKVSKRNQGSPIPILFNETWPELQKVVYMISILSDINIYNIQQYPKIIGNINYPFIRNPSMVKILSRYLVMSAYPGYPGYNQNIKVYWLNFSNTISQPYNDPEPYYCIHSKKKSSLKPGYDFNPEDVRMLVLDQYRVHLVYTIANTHTWQNIGTSTLIFKLSNQCYELVHSRQLLYPLLNVNLNSDTVHVNRNEKNWSPFLYDNRILYIKHINPLIIVEASPIIIHGSSNTTIYSQDEIQKHIRWKFGELRGGSNAIYIGKGKYLAFFHSRIKLSMSKYTTYFMGAYTFSTKYKPFRLLEISPFPILQNEWYSDFTMNSYQLDYIVFPMSLIVEESELILSYGRQDRYGFIARFELSNLLDNLERIYRHEFY